MGVRLRVMSYNVRGQRDDLDALGRVVRELAPDVVCAQETCTWFRWRYRSADLARRWGMVVASGGLRSLGNVVIVSHRVRLHDAWTMQFPLKPGRHMRGAAFARCSVAGEQFLVAGTHLATDDAERPSQAVRLGEVLDAQEAPVLLGADLNEPPGSPAFELLAAGRIDAAAAAGKSDVPTFSTGNPRRRIDVLFLDQRCTLLDYQRVDTEDVYQASDHFPILADLKLP